MGKKAYAQVEISLYLYLASVLDGSQLHGPMALPVGKEPPLPNQ
jgi:hypothetical protein